MGSAGLPGEVGQWKIQAFLEVQRQLAPQPISNLISLGDSDFEMDAVHAMGQECDEAIVKTVEFREKPSPQDLLNQLELAASKFEMMALKACDLTIGFVPI